MTSSLDRAHSIFHSSLDRQVLDPRRALSGFADLLSQAAGSLPSDEAAGKVAGASSPSAARTEGANQTPASQSVPIMRTPVSPFHAVELPTASASRDIGSETAGANAPASDAAAASAPGKATTAVPAAQKLAAEPVQTADEPSGTPDAATYDSWFQRVEVVAAPGIPGGYVMERVGTASESGAQEALRLVQKFVPDAKVVADEFDALLWKGDKPVYRIQLPNGNRLNAGHILNHYYQGGRGTAADIPAEMGRLIQMSMGETPSA